MAGGVSGPVTTTGTEEGASGRTVTVEARLTGRGSTPKSPFNARGVEAEGCVPTGGLGLILEVETDLTVRVEDVDTEEAFLAWPFLEADEDVVEEADFTERVERVEVLDRVDRAEATDRAEVTDRVDRVDRAERTLGVARPTVPMELVLLVLE